MSSHLWKAFYENDVDTFRQLLEAAANGVRPFSTRGGNAFGHMTGSPGGLGTSPSTLMKGRKPSGHGFGASSAGASLSKADVNWRDATGQTLLHHAASSTTDDAMAFATALIEYPLIDLYVQDYENGWTACHRAFYFGNVSIARFMLERDAGDALGKTTGHVHQTIGLVKIKDKEGHGPLDLYAATIKDRTLRPETFGRPRSGSNASDEDSRPIVEGDDTGDDRGHIPFPNVMGDQLFTFGSNQNLSLGFGDEDDRQFPERVNLRRPEHLIRRFVTEYNENLERKWSAHDPLFKPKTIAIDPNNWVEDLPWMIRSTPQNIQDVHMAKLSTAVLTSDPEANLYMCGHGQGGRLGAGDEQTRFHFVCIEGGSLAGKRVATVALGQNHTLALSDQGEIYSWGNNGFGQLGYSLPRATHSDDDPISTIPRQIFGPLKRETIIGIAASRIHSVAHSATSLFTFGKNEGQLGIMDSDARSLETQITPRKVAASLFTAPIKAVSAIDRATVCLLDNHDVWVFANYGYSKVSFPLEGFSNYFLKQSFLVTTYDQAPNRIVKIVGGGDTICALSGRGEVYTLSINQRPETQGPASVSTTNPSKIRSSITPPQRVWSPRKRNMAARDVDVDADGSIILSTEEGSVWRRTMRAKIKDTAISGTGDYKPKDYKFSRVPGLTRVLAVRASSYGAYAAVRRDCDVLKTQIVVEDQSLWKDIFSLLSLRELPNHPTDPEEDESRHRFWQSSSNLTELQLLKETIVRSKDVESDLLNLPGFNMASSKDKYDALITTSTSDVAIPVHRFILTSRSRVLRRGFRDLCETSIFTISDLAVSEIDQQGRTVIKFIGIDILTIIDLVLYLYTDNIVDFWHMTRSAPKMAFRYRQIRVELMKIALKLELGKLEPAVRQMVQPRPCLDMDMEVAFADPSFFHDGDAVVQLDGDKFRVHSSLLCERCPFFEGLFMGRAGGRWVAGRSSEEDGISVSLDHISMKTFGLVARYIYADTGAEMFDDIVSVGVDDFLDTVMDVMSAANELMLDRLSQICQSVVGRFVNVRNACGLLNAISPSSVHEFKDAGLEYLCLNLEAMLQGHHLNELEEDLSLELDDVVRENQLACMPFAKSGRAEMLLHERHPELATILDRGRRAKIDAVTLRSKFLDMASFAPGSFDDELSASPIQQKTRRISAQMQSRADSDRQSLKAKASSKDMMFSMDEESDRDPRSPSQSPYIRPVSNGRSVVPLPSSPPEDAWYDSRGKVLPSPRLGPQTSASATGTPRTPKSPPMGGRTPPLGGVPWSSPSLPGPASGMKDIMAQAASSRTSSLSQGLAAEAANRPGLPATPASFSLGAAKVSQKERKRMQHSQPSPAISTKETQPASPWRMVSIQKSPAFPSPLQPPPASSPAKSPNRRSPTPHLTMRQTVANPKPSPASKQAKTALQSHRSISLSDVPHRISREQQFPSLASSNSKPIPHSIRHQPLEDPILGLSISEIVAQQQFEKDVVKEAMAKRDLQEIQAEQEFQEWWEKESARVQEAERSAAADATKSRRRPRGRGGEKGGGGGGGGSRSARGKGKVEPQNGGNKAAAT
ncbi:Hypothetical protein R9X50_00110500 [Acrodontium crateriforme]|uniref:BTB domain-containing protein n=1 Tax=Acrodontium crateriforme TaxID=150365 RepID=A0AAQ3R9S0_9PEZI|nr:Hypothetical protein R9X50_00110500 [Acrodontium crateriforme]